MSIMFRPHNSEILKRVSKVLGQHVLPEQLKQRWTDTPSSSVLMMVERRPYSSIWFSASSYSSNQSVTPCALWTAALSCFSTDFSAFFVPLRQDTELHSVSPVDSISKPSSGRETSPYSFTLPHWSLSTESSSPQNTPIPQWEDESFKP